MPLYNGVKFVVGECKGICAKFASNVLIFDPNPLLDKNFRNHLAHQNTVSVEKLSKDHEYYGGVITSRSGVCTIGTETMIVPKGSLLTKPDLKHTIVFIDFGTPYEAVAYYTSVPFSFFLGTPPIANPIVSKEQNNFAENRFKFLRKQFNLDKEEQDRRFIEEAERRLIEEVNLTFELEQNKQGNQKFERSLEFAYKKAASVMDNLELYEMMKAPKGTKMFEGYYEKMINKARNTNTWPDYIFDPDKNQYLSPTKRRVILSYEDFEKMLATQPSEKIDSLALYLAKHEPQFAKVMKELVQTKGHVCYATNKPIKYDKDERDIDVF